MTRKCGLLDFFKYLIIGVGSLVLAQVGGSRVLADPPPSAPAGDKDLSTDRQSPWYIILNSPEDLAAFWRKIKRPDLVVTRGDQVSPTDARARSGSVPPSAPSWLVESVQVRGQVGEDFVNLKVEQLIAVKGPESVWATIRLDGQSLTRAREGAVELSLRRADSGQWQVKLGGEGEHRIQVELSAPLTLTAARKSLSLSIPEALSTGVELDFAHNESDIIVGANEVVSRPDPRSGNGTHLTAHLSPRPRLDLSWARDAETGGRNPPLLTAKSEIAVDIDEEQVRTRSSWAIRCVRGATRSLEIKMDDDEEVTELQLDDQSAESAIARVRGSGKMMIRLLDPLRAGEVKRMVMKTRRSFASAGARQVLIAGFSLTDARDQSGFIGITRGANLWVKAATSRGLRQVDIDKLPENLRTRPSTSLGFEFLDQPFLLDLGVESSPPLVRANSKTLFRIDRERVRSETTIELDWVRGALTELELGIAPGLKLIWVGPPEVVESSHISDETPSLDPGAPAARPRRLKVRLTPARRDPNRVTLTLRGAQSIPIEGKANLGLFTPVRVTSASASYALVADRGLGLELDDESGRIKRPSDPQVGAGGARAGWPWTSLRGEEGPAPLLLVDDGNSSALPIRIVRHARMIALDRVLSAQVSRRRVDLVERVSVAVRFGAVSSLEVRVPAGIDDRWELLDKELVDRQELGPGPDGSRRYRLTFERPVVDKALLRFRYRIALVPGLDSRTARKITIPQIAFEDVPVGPTKVEMSLAPEIVLKETDKAWARMSEDGRGEPASDVAVTSFEVSDASMLGRAFTFDALALEPVPLPSIVVPRLLLKTVAAGDDSARSSARYWVESHGPDFSFALPDGARWIGARVDGLLAEHVDYDPAGGSYRLRFPAEVGSRPVLVDLEYQLREQATRSIWPAPRLLDGGVVLQALWEVRLPASSALLGVPRGWSDENQWYWSGYMWKRRSWQTQAGLDEWAAGAGARAADDNDRTSLDYSDRYLFSRSGQPLSLAVWIVPRAWLVAICSGAALVVGFLAIFSKLRFRTIWLAIGGLGVLAAILVQPSVMFLVLESAVIGVVLTLVGLLIESLIERSRSLSMAARGGALTTGRAATDSSLKRSPGIGSDDSTAVRVRAPSTLDFVVAPAAGPEVTDEPRGSTWERA